MGLFPALLRPSKYPLIRSTSLRSCTNAFGPESHRDEPNFERYDQVWRPSFGGHVLIFPRTKIYGFWLLIEFHRQRSKEIVFTFILVQKWWCIGILLCTIVDMIGSNMAWKQSDNDMPHPTQIIKSDETFIHCKAGSRTPFLLFLEILLLVLRS